MAPTKDPSAILKELLADGECPGFVLVLSPDRIRRERIADKILSTFLGTKDHSLQNSVEYLDAAELTERDIAEVGDKLNSIPLFSSSGFIIIRDIDELKVQLCLKLSEIIGKADSPKTKVIALGTKLAATNPLLKLKSSEKRVLALEAPKGYDLKRWVARELGVAGIKKFEESVIDHLVQIGNESPDEVYQLVQKIALYVDGDVLTEKDIASLFPEHTVPNEFELVDAISSGKLIRAHLLSVSLLNAGKIPFVLLSILIKTYNNYLSIAYLLSQGKSPAEARAIMNANQWIFNKQLDGARKLALSGSARAMRNLLRADSKLKNRSLGAESVFEELIESVSPHLP